MHNTPPCQAKSCKSAHTTSNATVQRYSKNIWIKSSWFSKTKDNWHNDHPKYIFLSIHPIQNVWFRIDDTILKVYDGDVTSAKWKLKKFVRCLWKQIFKASSDLIPAKPEPKRYFWPQKSFPWTYQWNGFFSPHAMISKYFKLNIFSGEKCNNLLCAHWNISYREIENPKWFWFLTNWCGLSSFTFIIPPPSKEIYGSQASKIILGKGTYRL